MASLQSLSTIATGIARLSRRASAAAAASSSSSAAAVSSPSPSSSRKKARNSVADTVGNAGDFEQLHEGVTKMLGDVAFEAVTVQYDGARGLRSDVPQPVWWSVALERQLRAVEGDPMMVDESKERAASRRSGIARKRRGSGLADEEGVDDEGRDEDADESGGEDEEKASGDEEGGAGEDE